MGTDLKSVDVSSLGAFLLCCINCHNALSDIVQIEVTRDGVCILPSIQKCRLFCIDLQFSNCKQMSKSSLMLYKAKECFK